MSRSRRPMPLAVLAVVLAACTATPALPTATSTATSTVTPTPSEVEATASATAEPSPEASASGAAAEPARVEMAGSDFLPAELTITLGTQVAFVNVSDFAHTVTEGTGGRALDDPFVDEEVPEGGRAVVTFDEVGRFEITCRIHPTMQLTVIVEDA